MYNPLDMLRFSWAVVLLMCAAAMAIEARESDPLAGAELHVPRDGAVQRYRLAAMPEARITLRAQQAAPAVVHVHALDSTLGAGSPITALYEWDFGNLDGAFNQLSGFNAAHVYDQPGVYTVTLTVTNEAGQADQVTAQITVTQASRAAIYVSADGDDAADGATPQTAVASVARAMKLAGNNSEILFRRGDVFEVHQTIQLGSAQNVLIGAWGDGGEGDRPVLRAHGTAILNMGNGAANVTIESLAFDSEGTRQTAIFARGSGVTVRDNQFLRVLTAVDSYARPANLLVMNNTAPLAGGVSAYFARAAGTDHVYLGNQISDVGLHGIRGPVDRLLVAHNQISAPSASAQTTLNIRSGQWVHVNSNTFHDKPAGVGSSDAAAAVQWLVFENNQVLGNQFEIGHDVHHAMVRGNSFERDNASIIQLALAEGRNSDIRIEDNTLTGSGNRGFGLRLFGRAEGAISFRGNVIDLPNLDPGGIDKPALVAVHDVDMRSFAEISGNTWSRLTTRWAWVPADSQFYVGNGWHHDNDGYRTFDWWTDQPQVSTGEVLV